MLNTWPVKINSPPFKKKYIKPIKNQDMVRFYLDIDLKMIKIAKASACPRSKLSSLTRLCVSAMVLLECWKCDSSIHDRPISFITFVLISLSNILFEVRMHLEAHFWRFYSESKQKYAYPKKGLTLQFGLEKSNFCESQWRY